jgi:SRSO17 transposase
MSKKGQRQRRRLQAAPPSGQKPSLNVVPCDITAMADELLTYHAQFHDLFIRPEQRQWSEFYLRGQLSAIERKTVEPMVLALKGPDASTVRAVQQFIGEGAWSDEPVLERHQSMVGDTLGEPDAVVIFDGSGFPKQGTNSVGVARQYCGILGKIANCQEGVFAAYASTHGYTFLDRRLYMPECWFDDAHKPLRERCGMPIARQFQTEPELAIGMLRTLVERDDVPFSWVAVDEHFGMHPKFLDAVAALGKWYFAEVPVSTKVWIKAPQIEFVGQGPMGRPRKHLRVVSGEPPAEEVRAIAERLPKRAWKRATIKEGSKGPIEAEFALMRATRARRRRPAGDGGRVWVVFRRSTHENAEIKVYLSNAPQTCPKRELIRLSGMRWPIESAFEEAKGELGMDHYETRTWRGWHHHMTQTMLAHYFLVRMRLKLKKSSGDDSRASENTTGKRAAKTSPDARPSNRGGAISPAAELRGVPITSQTHIGKISGTRISA